MKYLRKYLLDLVFMGALVIVLTSVESPLLGWPKYLAWIGYALLVFGESSNLLVKTLNGGLMPVKIPLKSYSRALGFILSVKANPDKYIISNSRSRMRLLCARFNIHPNKLSSVGDIMGLMGLLLISISFVVFVLSIFVIVHPLIN